MKAYVVDTGALLSEPDLIYKLGFNETVVIPTAVIKELDIHKNSENEYEARAARDVARMLDQLGLYLDLAKGGQLRTGTILRTCTGFEKIRDFGNDIDNRVVGTALKLKGEFGYVAVISRDREMRDVTRAHGLKAKNWPLSLTRMDKAAPAAPEEVKTMEIHRPLRKEGLLRRLFRLLMAAFLKSGGGSSALSYKGGKR
ncbi:MAG: PIN domain-containing protein [Nitrospiraceae bacterium]|nr:PIN domain-containing protein [Nitrospiraceae bacterium]